MFARLRFLKKECSLIHWDQLKLACSGSQYYCYRSNLRHRNTTLVEDCYTATALIYLHASHFHFAVTRRLKSCLSVHLIPARNCVIFLNHCLPRLFFSSFVCSFCFAIAEPKDSLRVWISKDLQDAYRKIAWGWTYRHRISYLAWTLGRLASWMSQLQRYCECSLN